MLSHEAQVEAYWIGVRRSRAARRRGSEHLVGWRMDIEQERADGYSAVAEAVVADHVGGEWVGRLEPPPEDGCDVVGPEPDKIRYGVRWTPRLNGRLVVRTKDEEHLTMVLVVGIPPNQLVKGSYPTAAARQPRWVWEDAWMIPQPELAAL